MTHVGAEIEAKLVPEVAAHVREKAQLVELEVGALDRLGVET